MANKKIKNANNKEYNGIKFKSLLEVIIYKTLPQEGFNNIKYEPKTFVIWEGFKPSIPFYNKDKKTGLLKQETKKIIDIKYTPDFIFDYKGLTIFIEAKGFENDVFYIKKKLFRKFLENERNKNNNFRPLYFEIYNKKQLLQTINIIKDYDTNRRN